MKRCHKPDFYRVENTDNSKLKVLKPPTPGRVIHDSKDRQCSEKITHSNQHLLKSSASNKQQNVSPDITSSLNTVRYSPLDESEVVEVTVKTTTKPPKQRSRSTVSDRQPWGQLLSKRTTNGESESVFGKFDPLRTLHFLARELQTHMQARLPEETNLQEIIKAMHSALKRIPPEVASTVQLQQQTVDLLPRLKKSVSKDSFDTINFDKQDEKVHSKEFGEIQKLIEGSTMKLEASCRHLENICGQLRDEKISLETMLQSERTHSKLLQARIDEVESTNNQLSDNLNKKDKELVQLKSSINNLESKLQEKNTFNNDVQSTIIGDLKKSKVNLEQETLKLEHQLRLCAIEKEKYLAILAVRDRQIYEIRNEMTQLQESVNEQLVEIHSYALATVPANIEGYTNTQDKDDKEADGISSIWGNEDYFLNKSDDSSKDLDSGENNKKQRPP